MNFDDRPDTEDQPVLYYTLRLKAILEFYLRSPKSQEPWPWFFANCRMELQSALSRVAIIVLDGRMETFPHLLRLLAQAYPRFVDDALMNLSELVLARLHQMDYPTEQERSSEFNIPATRYLFDWWTLDDCTEIIPSLDSGDLLVAMLFHRKQVAQDVISQPHPFKIPRIRLNRAVYFGETDKDKITACSNCEKWKDISLHVTSALQETVLHSTELEAAARKALHNLEARVQATHLISLIAEKNGGQPVANETLRCYSVRTSILPAPSLFEDPDPDETVEPPADGSSDSEDSENTRDQYQDIAMSALSVATSLPQDIVRPPSPIHPQESLPTEMDHAAFADGLATLPFSPIVVTKPLSMYEYLDGRDPTSGTEHRPIKNGSGYATSIGELSFSDH